MYISIYFGSFCIIMLSWETKFSYTKFQMMAQNSGQHVIVTISFSLFPGLYDIYIYEKIICRLCEVFSTAYSLKYPNPCTMPKLLT